MQQEECSTATRANGPAYDYATFPRRFVSYKWFKPLLVGMLGFVFMLIFQIAVLVVAVLWEGDINFLYNLSVSYDDMNPYTAPGALVEIGGVATLLPALVVAALIVRDRPYSSYSSSRGGWNWSAFFKCVGVSIAVLAVLTLVQIVLFPEGESEMGAVRFTIAGFVMCTLLVPVQCAAEEYVFRGFFMQTVGAWTKLPLLAVAVQAALFASLHPYSVLGVVAIFLGGVASGLVAWQTKGLEASSALHIVNNLMAFYLGGFGLQATTSEVSVVSFAFTLLVDFSYAAVVLLVCRKRGWFYSKGDGAAKFNEKKLAKAAQRQARQAHAAPLAQGAQPMQGGQSLQAEPPAWIEHPTRVEMPVQREWPVQAELPVQEGQLAQVEHSTQGGLSKESDLSS